MCKKDGETLDHLLLHCLVAHELWSLVFSFFGVNWVMPGSILELLASWRQKLGSGGESSSMELLGWGATQSCLMWCIWLERNKRAFEV